MTIRHDEIDEDETPARNLTQAFEALCAAPEVDAKGIGGDSHDSSGPANGSQPAPAHPSPLLTGAAPPGKALISPVSVLTDAPGFPGEAAGAPRTEASAAAPETPREAPGASTTTAAPSAAPTAPAVAYRLRLHADLARDLSQACLERVAFYSVIHDINKEATAMYAADAFGGGSSLAEDEGITATPSGESGGGAAGPRPLEDTESPLVAAVLAADPAAAVVAGVGRAGTPTTTATSSDGSHGGGTDAESKAESSCTTDAAPAAVPGCSAPAAEAAAVAATPAANEPQPCSTVAEGEEEDADHDFAAAALVDEEEWLLQTVAARAPTERRACPDTFLQAIGEKDYDAPPAPDGGGLAGGTRTQLWKPSRSWWEAKSGRNAWIEPTSHNKRWRYLWPLIHYHKFLAKCIKKLKRNGVDVKQSISPVAVFLREEVCAISDHLAALSLFNSDQWMACLVHFHGWCDLDSEHYYREAVGKLKLRPVDEPGDIDSPLLRSQIDKHFLRSMANARAQLRENAPPVAHRTRVKPGSGPPPVYPRCTPVIPKHVQQFHSSMDRTQRHHHKGGRDFHHFQYTSEHAQWWTPQQQWEQANGRNAAYCDSASVHSAHSTLSVDSYPMSVPNPMYHAGASVAQYPAGYSPHYASYYHQHHHPPNAEISHTPTAAYGYSGAMYDPNTGHYFTPNGHWVDPTFMYQMHMQTHGHYYSPQVGQGGVPPMSPETEMDAAEAEPDNCATETPEKGNADEINTSMSQSPFWSHLDLATMTMGLATPVKASPTTPQRRRDNKGEEEYLTESSEGRLGAGNSLTAQPLLLQHGHYYGNYRGAPYGAAHETYGPPSPATQFMMSPQNGFSYNYGYGFSPNRKNKPTPRSSDSNQKTADKVAPANSTPVKKLERNASPLIHKCSPKGLGRESPSTIGTTIETASLQETS